MEVTTSNQAKQRKYKHMDLTDPYRIQIGDVGRLCDFGYTEADLYVALIPCNMPPYEGELSLVGDLLHANEDP